ncbi:transcriptional regulator [Mycolicibacterium parafortuitum]|uniref:GAF and ANTAR domain-containing protein n=1 Tax=Mycolicibacterium parafortuitum TaxID=39692 RepID=UPI0032C40C47
MTASDRSEYDSGKAPRPRLVEGQQLIDLVEKVGELQRRTSSDPQAALVDMSHAGVASVPGAQCAGITVVGKRHTVTTLAATNDYPTLLDRIQETVGEGPCLSAAWSHHTIRVDDIAADRRWPRYSSAAIERTPVRSVLSFRLYHGGGALAALNFYATEAEVFDDDSVELGLIFAAHAAAALTLTQREDQFRSALASRDVIGQAKGMLMERFGIDAQAAFELLRRLSQEQNVKLVDIAESLVALHNKDG